MRCIRRLSAAVMSVLLILSILVPGVNAQQSAYPYETTVLFTHDLHSHFLPQETPDGGESGGYARLSTALKEERRLHPDALTVDGGDFSIGSLIQTLYTTQAAELRTMAAMGYDAVCVGNHEFDHTGAGFAQMLTSAVQSGDPLPPLLMANYKPSPDNPDQLDIQRAMAAYGLRETMLLERGGVTYGIFGIYGIDSHACSPTSGFELEDPVAAARRCVEELEQQGAEFIICLSHSGTNEKKSRSEDEQLAKKADGIDLIISGHTHTTLQEPIVVNNTYVVSAGPYCENLGTITLRWNDAGEKELVEYKLTPIDETIPDDPQTAGMIEGWKKQVNDAYLARYNLTYDQVLTRSSFDLPTPASGVQTGNALGELISDSYLWAVENLEQDAPDVQTVAVVADGVIRAPISSGPVTVSQAFDVLSMGVGSDGTSGFPLVGCYLTGKELKAAAEIDASVTPIMPVAQLYFSGLNYSFNTHRMFFNRVTDIQYAEPSLTFEERGLRNTMNLQDDQLYRIVTGMYSAQMLGSVKDKSMGLLSLEPKMADGTPVTDFNECILRDKNGSEIKEWYALAAYLSDFGSHGVPTRYDAPDGRKDVSDSLSPIELFKHPNWITLAAMAVIVILAAVIILLVRHFLFRTRRGYRRSGRRYRG